MNKSHRNIMMTGVALAGLFIAGAQAQSGAISKGYGELPLSFEPNVGQADPRVQFLARGAGYTIFLSPTSATFALEHRSKAAQSSAVIRMDLVGANHASAMESRDKLPGISNYLMGNSRAKWPTNLPTYARTSTRNVYPGIDLVYYGTQGRLEYDFVLAPGADPSRIRMTFAGATPVIDRSGDLVLPLGTKDGQSDIRFQKPVLYQLAEGVRQPVGGNFTITRNHEVKFRVSSYDHNRELVIDPMLLYSSYIGGSALSQVNAMAVNAAGDIYLVGSTEATNYPTTPGVIQPTCPLGNTQNGFPAGLPKCGQGESGTPAAFVSKISADGKTLIYSTYLGGGGDGSGLEYGTGIAVDSGDNAWVVGQTTSDDFPITADAYLPYCAPGEIYSGINVISPEGSTCGGNANSLFLVQLNPTGKTELYGTFLGDTNGVLGAQIVLDAAGDIYIAGSAYTNTVGTFAQTGAYTFPTTPSAYQPLPIGGSSYSSFVSEFAPGGKSLIYSTIFGGPYQNTYNGALAVNAGKIFIGGYTQDPHLPTTPGALSHTCVGGPTAKGPGTVCINGSQNAYVAEFDPTKSGAASLVFSTYLNGSVSTQGTEMSTVNALAADAKGNVYAGGQDTYTNKEHFPSTKGVVQPTCFVATNSGQCGTGFVTKLSPSGSLVWSTFYGDTSQTGGEGVGTIALDSSDDVYIAGNAQNLGGYLLNNPFQTFMGGGAYITELSSDASQVLFGSFYGGAANVYPTGMVVDPAGNIYLAGYTNADLPLVKAYQSKNYGGGFPEGFFAKISLAPAAGAPAPNLVLSASSFGAFPAVAPGSWIEVYGLNLAPKTDGWAKDFNGNDAPTVVDGVSVKIGGVPAFVDYISPTQVNAQLPSNIPTGGMLPLTLTNGTETSLAYNIMVNATEPGLLAASAFKIGGKQYVVAQHLDGSYVLPKGAISGVTSSPAKVGETIVIYGVGFGSVTPNIPAGEIATEASRLSAPFTMQFGKTRADVTYLGLSPDSVGVYQFNVVVPAEGTSDLVPLTFTLGGVAGTQTLYTAIEQ